MYSTERSYPPPDTMNDTGPIAMERHRWAWNDQPIARTARTAHTAESPATAVGSHTQSDAMATAIAHTAAKTIGLGDQRVGDLSITDITSITASS